MEISAAEFRANCLKLIDRVHRSGEEIVITKRGKPLARLSAFHPNEAAPFLGSLPNVGRTAGDLTAPIETDAWQLD